MCLSLLLVTAQQASSWVHVWKVSCVPAPTLLAGSDGPVVCWVLCVPPFCLILLAHGMSDSLAEEMSRLNEFVRSPSCGRIVSVSEGVPDNLGCEGSEVWN